MSQTTQQRNRNGRPGERPRRPRRERVEPEWIPKTIPVSYTHLTLPTNREV